MIITLFEERCFADVIQLNILREGIHPEIYSWTLNTSTRILITQREIRLRNREEDRHSKEEEAS